MVLTPGLAEAMSAWLQSWVMHPDMNSHCCKQCEEVTAHTHITVKQRSPQVMGQMASVTTNDNQSLPLPPKYTSVNILNLDCEINHYSRDLR